MDINWNKTEIMFISKKMATNNEGDYRLRVFPEYIMISGFKVKVVTSFKLLGITIDNKLNFRLHVSKMRRSICIRLFSIKKLFYLSNSVKLQFFKTFILPYFDYCLSLCIYFPKTTIQKLSNCYYLCINLLLKFKFSNTSNFNCMNSELQTLNLQTFQHRLLYNLIKFSYKILNIPDSPLSLKNKLILYDSGLNLRNSTVKFLIPDIGSLNKYGERTFGYFFSKFLNEFSNLHSNYSYFYIKNNINTIFNKFTLILINKFNIKI